MSTSTMKTGMGVAALVALATVAVAAERAVRKPLGFADIGVYGTLFDFCDFSVYKLRYSAETAKPERLARYRATLHETAAKGKRNLVGLYTFDRIKHSRPIEEYIANTDAVLDAIDLADVYAVFLSEENVTWANGLNVLNALYDHIKKRHPKLPVYQWLTAPTAPHPKLKADGWCYDLYGPDPAASRRTFSKYVVTGKPFVVCINASPSVALLDEPKGRASSQGQVDACREFNIPMFFFCVDTKWGSPTIWLRSEDEDIAAWRRWLLGVVNEAHRIDTSALPLPSAQYSTGSAIEAAGDGANRVEFRDGFDTLQFVDDATIMGFLNLRWAGLEKALIIERQAGEMGFVELQYHFVSEFELSRIVAKLTGKVMSGTDEAVGLALSVTGHSWPHEAIARPGQGGLDLTASGADDPAFRGREFWVRLTCKLDSKQPRVAASRLDALTVTCHATPPERQEVMLVPDKAGKVAYRDDFASTKHLHLAHITNEQELEWRRGRLGTHGVKGRANVVTLRWKFVAERPIKDIKVRLACSANQRDLGATNTLAVSLDGATRLLEESTSGKGKGRFRGTLELDLAKDKRFRGLRDFWVHAEMRNGCGLKTGTSNVLDALEVEGAVQADE